MKNVVQISSPISAMSSLVVLKLASFPQNSSFKMGINGFNLPSRDNVKINKVMMTKLSKWELLLKVYRIWN